MKNTRDWVLCGRRVHSDWKVGSVITAFVADERQAQTSTGFYFAPPAWNSLARWWGFSVWFGCCPPRRIPRNRLANGCVCRTSWSVVLYMICARRCPAVAADIGTTCWQLRNGAGIVVSAYDVPVLLKLLTVTFGRVAPVNIVRSRVIGRRTPHVRKAACGSRQFRADGRTLRPIARSPTFNTANSVMAERRI
jgi:hypothetical protein